MYLRRLWPEAQGTCNSTRVRPSMTVPVGGGRWSVGCGAPRIS